MAKNIALKPLGDRVVVRPAKREGEKKLASGIILPEVGDKERPMQGTVVAVGPGRYEDGAHIPVAVSIGDEVLFSKYGPDEVKIDGEEYYVLSESSVLAVIST